jgi:hypothetical protein
MDEEDPVNNLPHVIDRPELGTQSIHDAWRTICRQARINHVGVLVLP